MLQGRSRIRQAQTQRMGRIWGRRGTKFAGPEKMMDQIARLENERPGNGRHSTFSITVRSPWLLFFRSISHSLGAHNDAFHTSRRQHRQSKTSVSSQFVPIVAAAAAIVTTVTASENFCAAVPRLVITAQRSAAVLAPCGHSHFCASCADTTAEISNDYEDDDCNPFLCLISELHNSDFLEMRRPCSDSSHVTAPYKLSFYYYYYYYKDGCKMWCNYTMWHATCAVVLLIYLTGLKLYSWLSNCNLTNFGKTFLFKCFSYHHHQLGLRCNLDHHEKLIYLLT